MKSFLAGKRTLDVVPLRAPSGPSALAENPPGPGGAPAPAMAPHVDIVKQGDKIVRLVITCACGERTEIECLYPPGQ